jgi:hypothetical protein
VALVLRQHLRGGQLIRSLITGWVPALLLNLYLVLVLPRLVYLLVQVGVATRRSLCCVVPALPCWGLSLVVGARRLPGRWWTAVVVWGFGRELVTPRLGRLLVRVGVKGCFCPAERWDVSMRGGWTWGRRWCSGHVSSA